MIEGKSKFKSWWGAFFSLLVIVSVLSYAGLKILFTLHNQASNLQQRALFNGADSELGQAVLTLNESQVSVDFEFWHNPSRFATNKGTPITSSETYMKDLQSFTEFIIVEAHTIERDLEARTETTTTEILPFEIRMKDLGSEYGTPTMRVDASMLKLRGDPYMNPELLKRNRSHGRPSPQFFQTKGLVKDLAGWVNLDQEFPDLGPHASDLWSNITSLFGGGSDADDAEQTETGGNATSNATEDSKLYNPIISAITFRPDYEKLEELAAAAYNG